MQRKKIISWNVNGIRAVGKKGLLPFLEREAPDIFCVQETKAHPEQVEPAIREPLGVKGFWSSAQKKGYSGVATFCRSGSEPIRQSLLGEVLYDNEGRVVITDHRDFLLYNIYFPNGGSGVERHNFKQKFLLDLNLHLKSQLDADRQIIVVGDYNVAHREVDIYDPVRLSKESGFLPEERAWFDSFLQLGFVDTFRHVHPTESDRYTWWSYVERARPLNRGWRIDYICVSEGLKDRILDARVRDDVEGSDHCPVELVLK